MATVKNYVDAMTAKEKFVCEQYLGVSVAKASSIELRAVNLILKIFIGGLMKALVDKGVVTDTEISNAIDSTLTDGWGELPLDPPPDPS